MNYRAHIEAIDKKGFSRYDIPWVSYGQILTREEALKRAEKVFNLRKYSKEEYKIHVYESTI